MSKMHRIELNGAIKDYLSRGGQISRESLRLNWKYKQQTTKGEPLIIGRKTHPCVIGHKTSNHLTRFDLDTIARLEAERRRKKKKGKRHREARE
jgi:hypothetical protein